MDIPEYYFCGIKRGIRYPFIPGNNYGNRFTGEKKDGSSTLRMSPKLRENPKDSTIDVFPNQIVVEDNLISKLFDISRDDCDKAIGVFLEFSKEGETFRAVGMPIVEAGNSYLSIAEFLWPMFGVDFEFALACMIGKANKYYKQTLKGNIIFKGDEIFGEELQEEIKTILEPTSIWNRHISDLYVYSSRPSQEIYSLYHIIKEKAKDPNWELVKQRIWKIILGKVCEKFVGDYVSIHHYRTRGAAFLDRFNKNISRIRDRSIDFYNTTMANIDTIMEYACTGMPCPASYRDKDKWANPSKEFFKDLSRILLQ